MGAYLARRLLALIPTLLLASIIVFATIRLIPGDVIDLMLSQNDVAADKMSREQLVATLGLDKPMATQYLSWVGGIALRGDLGQSLWQNAPVTELLAARLPVTFELGLLLMGQRLRHPFRRQEQVGLVIVHRPPPAGDRSSRTRTRARQM